jgi:hypothetical protein
MPKAFSLMGEVTCDLTQVEMDLAVLEKRKTRTKLDFDTSGANKQASAMKQTIRDLDKATAKPKVKAEGVAQATAEVQKLDALLKNVGTTTGKVRVEGEVGGSVGGSLMSLAAAGGFAVGAMGLKALLSQGIESATFGDRMRYSLEQAFGDAGDVMVAEAKKLQEATGFSSSSFMEAQLVLSDLADVAGASTAQINSLVSAAADIAASTGIAEYRDNVQGVTEALVVGAQGMGRGLKRLGIDISDAYMAQVYAGGRLAATWASLSIEQKEQARIGAILEQTAKTAGAAANDADQFHGQLRRVKEEFNSAAGDLGAKLLPILTKVLALANAMPKWTLEAGMVTAGVAVGGLGLATLGQFLGPVVKGLAEAVKGAIGAAAAAATLEGGALAAAGTLEAGAVVAAGTAEGGAVAAAGTIEAGAATAAGTLQAGATAAAAELAAGGAAGGAAGAAGGLLGKIAMAVGASGVGGVASGVVGGSVLALPAVVAAGLALKWGSNEQKREEQGLADATARYEKNALRVARATGMGDISDPEQARYVRAYTKWSGGKYVDYNAYHQPLLKSAQDWQSQGRQPVSVTLVDKTSAGVRAQTDAGSYEPALR